MSLPFDDDVVGYEVVSTVNCALNKDGFWEVTQKLVQSRTKDGKDWEAKELEFRALDTDIMKAINTSYMTVAYYLEQVEGNLFNDIELPEDSPVVVEKSTDEYLQ